MPKVEATKKKVRKSIIKKPIDKKTERATRQITIVGDVAKASYSPEGVIFAVDREPPTKHEPTIIYRLPKDGSPIEQKFVSDAVADIKGDPTETFSDLILQKVIEGETAVWCIDEEDLIEVSFQYAVMQSEIGDANNEYDHEGVLTASGAMAALDRLGDIIRETHPDEVERRNVPTALEPVKDLYEEPSKEPKAQMFDSFTEKQIECVKELAGEKMFGGSLLRIGLTFGGYMHLTVEDAEKGFAYYWLERNTGYLFGEAEYKSEFGLAIPDRVVDAKDFFKNIDQDVQTALAIRGDYAIVTDGDLEQDFFGDEAFLDDSPLTEKEEERLAAIEADIEMILPTWRKDSELLGDLVNELIGGRLYRKTHRSLGRYLLDKFDLPRSTAYQLAACAEVNNALGGMDSRKLPTQRQALQIRSATRDILRQKLTEREVANYEKLGMRFFWEITLQSAPTTEKGMPIITHSHMQSVKDVLQRIVDTDSVDVDGADTPLSLIGAVTANVTDETFERTRRRQQAIIEDVQKTNARLREPQVHPVSSNGNGAEGSLKKPAKVVVPPPDVVCHHPEHGAEGSVFPVEKVVWGGITLTCGHMYVTNTDQPGLHFMDTENSF